MKKTIVLIILLLPYFSYSQKSCYSIFSNPQNLQKQELIQPENTLNFNKNTRLGLLKYSLSQSKLTDYFSESFLSKLETEYGSEAIKFEPVIEIPASWKRPLSYVFDLSKETYFRITVEGEVLVVFGLYYSSFNPKEIFIDGLRLQNPLNQNKNKRSSQMQKGLPMSEFLKLKNALIQKIKSSGLETLKTTGSENLMVSSLYKRIVHMKPEGTYKQYDHYFDELIKNNIFTLSELNESFGDAGKIDYELLEAEKIWKNSTESDFQNLGFTPVYFNTKIVGYKSKDRHQKDIIYVIDPFSKNKRFVMWSVIYDEGATQLELQL